MSDEPVWLRPFFAQLYEAKWGDEELPDFADFQDRFVFHMADAADEIHQLNDLLNVNSEHAPEMERFADLLGRFFLHAVPHLVAAGQLYDYIPEIFPEQKGVHTLPCRDPDGGQSDSSDEAEKEVERGRAEQGVRSR